MIAIENAPILTGELAENGKGIRQFQHLSETERECQKKTHPLLCDLNHPVDAQFPSFNLLNMCIRYLRHRWLSPLIPLFPLPVTEGDVSPL